MNMWYTSLAMFGLSDKVYTGLKLRVRTKK